MHLLCVLKCFDLKIVIVYQNRFICVEFIKQRLKNENFLKCVFCSRYLYKNCCVAEQTLPKNTASDKSEAVCMPCSTKFNINNLGDISVHDLIESNTSRKPENVVSNPTCEDFFDNCAYHDQNSFKNLVNSRSLQKIFDSFAYYLSELEQPPDVIDHRTRYLGN